MKKQNKGYPIFQIFCQYHSFMILVFLLQIILLYILHKLIDRILDKLSIVFLLKEIYYILIIK